MVKHAGWLWRRKLWLAQEAIEHLERMNGEIDVDSIDARIRAIRGVAQVAHEEAGDKDAATVIGISDTALDVLGSGDLGGVRQCLEQIRDAERRCTKRTLH